MIEFGKPILILANINYLSITKRLHFAETQIITTNYKQKKRLAPLLILPLPLFV